MNRILWDISIKGSYHIGLDATKPVFGFLKSETQTSLLRYRDKQERVSLYDLHLPRFINPIF